MSLKFLVHEIDTQISRLFYVYFHNWNNFAPFFAVVYTEDLLFANVRKSQPIQFYVIAKENR